jgi:hypothetical protein
MIMCDLDGVLFDASPFVDKYSIDGKLNWDEYLKHQLEIKPIPEMVPIIKTLILMDPSKFIFASGRPESTRADTVKSLNQCLGVVYGYRLCMRPRDYKLSTLWLKMEWYHQYQPDLIIEDDPEVVERALQDHFTVLQVHGYFKRGSKYQTPYK